MISANVFAIVGTAVGLVGLIASVSVAWSARKQARHAAEQAKAAAEQAKAAAESSVLAGRDLSLTAYAHAVQAIVDLKNNFAENPDTFQQQVELNPVLQGFIPPYMSIPSFLTFARGMWRFSYLYSVYTRGEQLGLTEDECEGLKNEMLLWLQYVPGFKDVYRYHIIKTRALNPKFLQFLEEKVYPDVAPALQDVKPVERQ